MLLPQACRWIYTFPSPFPDIISFKSKRKAFFSPKDFLLYISCNISNDVDPPGRGIASKQTHMRTTCERDCFQKLESCKEKKKRKALQRERSQDKIRRDFTVTQRGHLQIEDRLAKTLISSGDKTSISTHSKTNRLCKLM